MYIVHFMGVSKKKKEKKGNKSDQFKIAFRLMGCNWQGHSTIIEHEGCPLLIKTLQFPEGLFLDERKKTDFEKTIYFQVSITTF